MKHTDQNASSLPENVSTLTGRKETQRVTSDTVDAAASHAASLIAPLWPLKHFVAVNPFMGFSQCQFAQTRTEVERLFGARLLMPNHFYHHALQRGRITDTDIAAALTQLGDSAHSARIAAIRASANADEKTPDAARSVADVVGTATGHDWQNFVIDRITTWAAGHFDEGQAAIAAPWTDCAPFTAWRKYAAIDRTPQLMGLHGFRQRVTQLPESAASLLLVVAERLELSENELPTYFARLLAEIAGWAGHARFTTWLAAPDEAGDTVVREMLAVRAAWDLLILESFDDADIRTAWLDARSRLLAPKSDAGADDERMVLHTAYEIAGRRPVTQAISQTASDPRPATDSAPRTPSAQAVFCIDVRSERFRRALERTDDGVDTLGFAGFFGFAIEVAEIDQPTGNAHCPVLLKPDLLVRASTGSADQDRALVAATTTRRRVRAAGRSFGNAAVASFAFVESLGLGYAYKLLADTLGLGPAGGRTGQTITTVDEQTTDGHASGIPLQQRIALATGALRGMSLTSGFADIVALIGHGSTTTNNPYASRLHCGACGGHTGEANAQVAAQVLNQPEVREALRTDGIDIPASTWFIAGLHDTAIDAVSLPDKASVPASHRDALARFESSLNIAGQLTREERASSFTNTATGQPDHDIVRRALDWSEVRPEWGLAGCRAFIAAPRARTRHTSLEGRSFLHSYDWQNDHDFSVLELIMTAPLVVATWINLQYFASTVDNDVFGSGDKTLHNIVGGLGVIEGIGGDLRVGLPWQSIHDGHDYVHEPMRLSAYLEAPREAINGVLEKHPQVRELADNGWIHLFAIGEAGGVVRRYTGDLTWAADAEAAADIPPSVAAAVPA